MKVISDICGLAIVALICVSTIAIVNHQSRQTEHWIPDDPQWMRAYCHVRFGTNHIYQRTEMVYTNLVGQTLIHSYVK